MFQKEYSVRVIDVTRMMDQVKEAYQFMVELRHVTQCVLKYQHGTIGHGIVSYGLKDVSNKILELQEFSLGK